MFKVLKWVSPTGNICEAMFEETKALAMEKILLNQGIQAQICDDNIATIVN